MSLRRSDLHIQIQETFKEAVLKHSVKGQIQKKDRPLSGFALNGFHLREKSCLFPLKKEDKETKEKKKSLQHIRINCIFTNI